MDKATRIKTTIRQAADLHRPRLAHREMGRMIGLKTTRCLRNDFTIAHQGRLYQSRSTIRVTHVPVEERVDGPLRIMHQGRPRGFYVITSRPVKITPVTPVPPSALGHAEAESSVAPTPAAGATNIGVGGEHINRTFLRWEKEDTSTAA